MRRFLPETLPAWILFIVITVPAGSDEATIKAAALADAKVAARMEGKTVVKVIYVPGKLLNIVVR